MNLAQKFEETKKWLLIALIERQEGRVPCDEEIIAKSKAVHFPNGSSDFYWKGKKILSAEIEEVEGGINGCFRYSESVDDEYIAKRATEWMN